MTKTTGGRTYGGLTAEHRQNQRRESLVDAGMELFGTLGYPNVSVKKICDYAGLTQRYFYESFDDRPALLGTVYEKCVQDARAATLAAAAHVFDDAGIADGPIASELVPHLAAATLGAFIDYLSDDARRARIIMIEVVGVSPELEKLRLQAIHGWANLILSLATSGTDPTTDQRLAAIGLVGALTQLLVDWQTALDAPIEDGYDTELFEIGTIHRVVTEMFIATYERTFAPDQP